MKVALVHSYYSSKQPSGENFVVDAQAEALTRAGHEVTILSARTDDLEQQKMFKVRAAYSVMSGAGLSPVEELNNFDPDIVHIHNLFPNWGTNWLKKWDGPVVATLHNFRPLCSAGTLFRDGEFCNLCPTSTSLAAVQHSCYRNSKLATIPIAVGNRKGVAGNQLIQRANKIFVLSPRAHQIYEMFGIPKTKLELLPNFVKDLPWPDQVTESMDWLYIGRLSPEKGILRLVQSWPQKEKLNIYGDGPDLAQLLKDISDKPNIKYLGLLNRSDISEVIRRSLGLVFPSECAEGGIPQVYVEALSCGRPIVAKTGNGAADDILSSGTGSVFNTWPQLIQALDDAKKSNKRLGGIARQHYENNFTISSWLSKIQPHYESLQVDGQ